MPILSDNSLVTTEFQDGQPAGSITPSRVRDLVESAFALVPSPNGAQTASYTAQLSDRGTIVPFNVASGSAGFTIPPNSSVAFAVGTFLGIIWISGSAIQPAFVAGAGVTIVTPSSLSLRVAGSIAHAWQYATNVWYLMGDLT